MEPLYKNGSSDLVDRKYFDGSVDGDDEQVLL